MKDGDFDKDDDFDKDGDFDVVGVAVAPFETNAVLMVDANAVLALAVPA